MEKRDKAEELMSNLSSVAPLEEVPSDVSKRFHETLSRLASEQAGTKPKTRWYRNTNQFALAASFVLVFALGAVVTLNSGGNPADPLGVVNPQSSVGPSDTDITDDQLQYSAGDKSVPVSSTDLIKQTTSSQDYADIPMDFYKKLGVGVTWNSAAKLDSETRQCLDKLQLTDSTNLIDVGLFKGEAIKAIWSPVTRSSWNVYLIDSSCVAIDKKFVQG
jgi:hypothetical protein